MMLNTASAFLYLATVYAVLPTAGLYAESLGSSKGMSGVLIGAAPLAGIFSSVYFSSMSSAGFKRPLVLASALCLAGNLMYSLAASFGSLDLAMAGRLIIGLGGARAINRRYISDCAPHPQLVQRSAEFVTASALGMSLGPAMAAVVNRLPPAVVFGLYFDHRTNGGWAMVLLWAAFLAALIRYFEELPRRPVPDLTPPPPALSSLDTLESGQAPLLTAEEGGRAGYGAVPAVEEARRLTRPGDVRSRASSSPLRDLLSNKVVLFGLFVYFVIKFLCELMVSSSALVLPYFFDWSESSVGAFVATIGLLMFPANIGVSFVSLRLEEGKQLMYSLGIVMFGCLLGVPLLGSMLLPQYLLACIVLFVSTNVCEAVLMAVLARTMPTSLARGTWNSGLLATECGLLGRFVGDISTTVCASGVSGIRWILWRVSLPSTILAGVCIGGALYFENQLMTDGGVDETDSDEVDESEDKKSQEDFDDELETVEASELK
jgi:MFS family permease